MNEFAKTFEILTPVVIGISDVLVTIAVAACYGVEVRKVAWVGKYGDSDDDSGNYSTNNLEEVFGVRSTFGALEEVKSSFGYEYIEKGKDREEVTETDIEIAGDADIAVEHDKEKHESLSHTIPEGFSKETKPG